jgi:hypothetical protein
MMGSDIAHGTTGYHERFDQVVAQFIQDGVIFVGVVGDGKNDV